MCISYVVLNCKWKYSFVLIFKWKYSFVLIRVKWNFIKRHGFICCRCVQPCAINTYQYIYHLFLSLPSSLFLSLSLNIYIYIYRERERERIYIYMIFMICIYIYYRYTYVGGAFNNFPDFFVQAFKIVVDPWKFSILLLYILWDDWLIFMISGSNQQL